jgi:hypothetical protein
MARGTRGCSQQGDGSNRRNALQPKHVTSCCIWCKQLKNSQLVVGWAGQGRVLLARVSAAVILSSTAAVVSNIMESVKQVEGGSSGSGSSEQWHALAFC